MSKDNQVQKLLLQQSACCLCLDQCTPPIYTCASTGTSHNTCAKCQEHVVECCVCHGPKPDLRNTDLEQVLAEMKYPCTNNDGGCKEMLILSARDAHQLTCKHVVVACIIPHNGGRCSWKGSSAKLVRHVENVHVGRYRVCNIFEITYEIEFSRLDLLNNVQLIKFSDCLFWRVIKYEAEMRALSGAVFSVERDTNVKDFNYEFYLKGQSKSHSLVYRSDVRWIGAASAHKTKAMFSVDLLEEFVNVRHKIVAFITMTTPQRSGYHFNKSGTTKTNGQARLFKK